MLYVTTHRTDIYIKGNQSFLKRISLTMFYCSVYPAILLFGTISFLRTGIHLASCGGWKTTSQVSERVRLIFRAALPRCGLCPPSGSLGPGSPSTSPSHQGPSLRRQDCRAPGESRRQAQPGVHDSDPQALPRYSLPPPSVWAIRVPLRHVQEHESGLIQRGPPFKGCCSCDVCILVSKGLYFRVGRPGHRSRGQSVLSKTDGRTRGRRRPRKIPAGISLSSVPP